MSLLGSQVTVVALPLTAIITLHADPAQMGGLRVATSLPFLVFGLLAGAWVDRRSRLGVMAFTSLGQGALLAVIPVLAITHALRIELVYGVAFLAGILTVLFDVANQAFLPSLVRSESLLDANSKLQTSASLVQVVGPSFGGALVQVLTAPFAILADVVSFVLAAVLLRSIPDPAPARPETRGGSLFQQIWDGLVALLGHPVLRAIVSSTTLVNLTVAIATPVLLLYMVQTLRLNPTLIGLALAVNGLGGVAGAFTAVPAARRLPMPVVLGSGLAVAGTGTLLIALAGGSLAVILPVVLLGEVLLGFSLTFFNVNALSLRQSLTPAAVQARVHATSRTLTWGAIPIGAVVGGILGEHIGLRGTLVVSGVGTVATGLIALFGMLGATRPAPTIR